MNLSDVFDYYDTFPGEGLILMIGLIFANKYTVPAALGVCLLLLLALEAARPLRRRTRSTAGRLIINLCVSGLAFAVAAITLRPVTTYLSNWTSLHRFGLVHLLDLPFAVRFALGFVLMDATFYYWHRANHVCRFLWRFHNVHHSDPDMDVSTSFRFHFAEVLLSVAFRVVQVGLLGITPSIYAVYEIVFRCATMFHHSNVRLPVAAERLVNKIIVTPRMHGIHHSDVGEEMNSNYSVIFRWPDALHRSLRLNVPQSKLTIGVPGYQQADDNRFLKLLIMPFVKQRLPLPLPDERRDTKETVAMPKSLILMQE